MAGARLLVARLNSPLDFVIQCLAIMRSTFSRASCSFRLGKLSAFLLLSSFPGSAAPLKVTIEGTIFSVTNFQQGEAPAFDPGPPLAFAVSFQLQDDKPFQTLNGYDWFSTEGPITYKRGGEVFTSTDQSCVYISGCGYLLFEHDPDVAYPLMYFDMTKMFSDNPEELTEFLYHQGGIYRSSIGTLSPGTSNFVFHHEPFNWAIRSYNGCSVGENCYFSQALTTGPDGTFSARVTIEAVPEPASLFLMLSGTVFFLGWHRRSNRRHP